MLFGSADEQLSRRDMRKTAPGILISAHGMNRVWQIGGLFWNVFKSGGPVPPLSVRDCTLWDHYFGSTSTAACWNTRRTSLASLLGKFDL